MHTGEHVGTHVDAPLHWESDMKTWTPTGVSALPFPSAAGIRIAS
ncbi:cyclase family protein [Streptomyces sp. NPDC002896]